jgi:hypothetical protein
MKRFTKGEIMKKSYSIILLTLTCLVGLGTSARAQDARTVVVNVPFEFVAGGQTLPAGKYTISRVSQFQQALVIHSDKDGGLMLPIVFDGVTANHAELSFEHAGDKYFLSEVGTPAGNYSMPIPRAMTKVAQMKDNSTMSPSGSN